MGDELRFVRDAGLTTANDGPGDVFVLSSAEEPSVVELTDIVLDRRSFDAAPRRGDASGMVYADPDAARSRGEDETEGGEGTPFRGEEEVDLFEDEESDDRRDAWPSAADAVGPLGTGAADASVEERLRAVSDKLATLADIIEESEQVRKGQATLIAERFDQLSAAVAVSQVTACDRTEDEGLSGRLERMSQECDRMLADLRRDVDGAVEAFESYRRSERDRLDGILGGLEERLARLERRPEGGPPDVGGIVESVSARLGSDLERAAASAAARVIREELARLV